MYSWGVFSNIGSGSGPSATIPLTDLLLAFIGSSPVAGKGVTATDISTLGTNASSLGSITPSSVPTTTANAHICWVLFNDQFRVVTTGADPVVNNGGYKLHTQYVSTPISVSKNGYLYVFVSNKSNLEVYFDNLVVTHYKGPILEETHYYPFGLTMAGISSRAIGKLENKYKFNDGTEFANKEFSDGNGIEWYETTYRSYDPQIGRFHQIDPYAEEFDDFSPYMFASNNPVLLNDPLGLKTDTGTNKTNLDPVTVTAKVSPWKQYLNRMRIGQEMGMDGPAVLEGDSKRTTREMRRIHEYETRKDAMDRAVGEAEIEIASWILPVGKIGQGIRWLFRLKKATQAAKAITAGRSWIYGAFKSEAKWASQLSKRGWTVEQVTEAVTKGKSFEAVNMVNKANGATRYVHPTTGQSAIIDNVTKELLHVGGPGLKY